MEVAIDAARWVVDKALSPLSGGLLETWAASSELGVNIDAIKMELLYAKGMLENAQGREIRSQALKELLQKLQHLAFDADDVLDELDYFRIHDELKGTYEAADVDDASCFRGILVNSRHTAAKALYQFGMEGVSAFHVHENTADDAVKSQKWWQKHCCCSPNPGRDRANEVPMLKFDRVGISTRMKHIVEQLQPICAKVSVILNMEMLGSNNRNTQDSTTSQRLTISESVEPKLYGRNKMKDEIIRDVTKGIYSEQGLSVLSLFGPGGIGKTTLVQYIYNNQEVQSHFHVKIWVCVSFSFNVSMLLQQIKDQIPKVDGENGTAEDRIEQRFLLILDDMWKCDGEDMWKRLLVPFSKGQAKGNVVLVTTRFPALAEMVNTIDQPIELERLEHEEFMQLFEACVFGEAKAPWQDHSELLDTGKKIIGKLKGFPLAAKTVGSLKKLSLEWDVQRSDKEPDKEERILNVLRPHDNLQELCIRGHGGHSCPPWLGSKLSVKNLQSLHIDTVDWTVFPPLGELWLPKEPGQEYLRSVQGKSFQNLKTLELVGLTRLEKWVHNDTCLLFSLLETFIIRDCPELVELPVSQYASLKFKQDVRIDLFPKMQELRIADCPKLESLPPIPWTDTLHTVDMKNVGSSLKRLVYSTKSSSSKLSLEIKEDHHLECLDEMVAFHNLSKIHELEVSKSPPLMHKHLHGLTSLKTLKISDSSITLQLLGGPDDEKHMLALERLEIQNSSAHGKELTQFLLQLPKLSFFRMSSCQNTSSNEMGSQLQMEEVADEGGLLLFPQHLTISLRELRLRMNPGLSLLTSLPPENNSRPGGGLHNLHSLQTLLIRGCPKLLSAYSSSSSYCCPFPSALDFLRIEDVEGMNTLAPFANLTSLTYLYIENCGKNLRGEGLLTLFTQGCLTVLCVYRSPNFFDNWVSWIVATECQQQKGLPVSCKLQALRTDDIAGVLVAPICRLFSSSLNVLGLCSNKEIVSFTKEQEKALELISSLQELCFFRNEKLQSLPADLRGLNNLRILEILRCPAIRSLPKNAFPNSLRKINVDRGCSEKLQHHCIMLEGLTVNIDRQVNTNL
uniref:AAA+ ATPase domain-containing protein n=1 Tax=Oryza meridionalis TaxID=40149 RepID=A0A0E0F4H0_9ORYZ